MGTIEMAKDTFPGLFWGYLVVWGLLSLYILSLGFRVSRLENQLSAKKERSSIQPSQ